MEGVGSKNLGWEIGNVLDALKSHSDSNFLASSSCFGASY